METLETLHDYYLNLKFIYLNKTKNHDCVMLELITKDGRVLALPDISIRGRLQDYYQGGGGGVEAY